MFSSIISFLQMAIDAGEFYFYLKFNGKELR